MKNIYKGLVLVSTMFAFCSMDVVAQENQTSLPNRTHRTIKYSFHSEQFNRKIY